MHSLAAVDLNLIVRHSLYQVNQLIASRAHKASIVDATHPVKTRVSGVVSSEKGSVLWGDFGRCRRVPALSFPFGPAVVLLE